MISKNDWLYFCHVTDQEEYSGLWEFFRIFNLGLSNNKRFADELHKFSETFETVENHVSWIEFSYRDLLISPSHELLKGEILANIEEYKPQAKRVQFSNLLTRFRSSLLLGTIFVEGYFNDYNGVAIKYSGAPLTQFLIKLVAAIKQLEKEQDKLARIFLSFVKSDEWDECNEFWKEYDKHH